MKRVLVLVCCALIAACADEDSQESTHIGEAKRATAEEAQAAFPIVQAQTTGAFIDLRKTARQQGGTNEAIYSFQGYTHCNNSGFYSGGGTFDAAHVDFQLVFTDCQGLPGEISLDGRTRYRLDRDEAQDVERYSTTMTFGQTESDPDHVTRYISCTSELTIVHDATSITGSGTFCDIKVDDTWSFDA